MNTIPSAYYSVGHKKGRAARFDVRR